MPAASLIMSRSNAPSLHYKKPAGEFRSRLIKERECIAIVGEN